MFLRTLVSRPFVVLASRRVVAPRYVLPSFRHASTATATASSLRPQPTLSIPHTTTTPTPNTEEPLRFDALEGTMSDGTLRAITQHPFKYVHMSAVQQEILPLLPQLTQPDAPTDLLVKAKTGTGKTLAFLVPAIESRLKELEAHVEAKRKEASEAGMQLSARDVRLAKTKFGTQHVGTLIISPTRELASQIAVEATNLTKNHPEMNVQVFLGGESKYKQLTAWKGRKDIVVATPGRLLDLMHSVDGFSEYFKSTKLLILDEADTLLDMGFRDDIDRIKRALPKTSLQTFLFSATVSPAIQQVAAQTLDPSHLFINCVPQDDSPVHAHIPQHYTICPTGNEGLSHVLNLIAHDQLTHPENSKIILFLPTTKMVQLFSSLMSSPMMRRCLPRSRETTVYEIHSKRDMKQRVRTSEHFRKDTSGACILLTSDVSARGVDYPNVTRVIQVGAPNKTDTYIHRVGRTGRGSNKVGRGDLVMAPWESRFATVKLSDVPLKPLTVAALREELDSLAPPSSASSSASTLPGEPRSKIISDSLQKTIETVVDPQEVSSTFAAQLGFYAGNFGEQGVRKEEIYEGLRTWMGEMWGLSKDELYASSDLLTKIGLGRGSSSGGGFRERKPVRYGSSSSSSYGSGRRSEWGGGREDEYRPRGRGGFDRGDKSFGERRSSFGERRSFDGGERRSFDGDRRSRSAAPAWENGRRSETARAPRRSSSEGGRGSRSSSDWDGF